MNEINPGMSFNQDYGSMFNTTGFNPTSFSSVGNVQPQQMLAGIPLSDNYMTMLGNGEIQGQDLQSYLKPQGFNMMSSNPSSISMFDNVSNPYDLRMQYGTTQQGRIIPTSASDIGGTVVKPYGFSAIGSTGAITDAKGNVVNYNFGGKTDPSKLDYFNAGVGTVGAIANFSLANRNAKDTRAQNARDNARNDKMMNMYIDKQAGSSAIDWGAGWSVDANGKPVYDATKGQTQAQYDTAKSAKAKALKDM